MTTWVDNHCHIPPGADGDAWVEAARAAGVDEMVTVGVTHERSVEAIAVAARHERVYATVGVHPHDAKDGIDGIAELIGSPDVVAIGEAGLDYHYDHSPRDVQREVFAQHIKGAFAQCSSVRVVERRFKGARGNQLGEFRHWLWKALR